jgi:hypothetical protein
MDSKASDNSAIIRKIGLVLFIVGVLISATYASRAVTPTGTGPNGAVTSTDKLKAWGSAAGVPFGIGMVLVVAGAMFARRKDATDGAAAPTSLRHAEGPIAMLAAMRTRLGELQGIDIEQSADKLRASLDALLEEEVPQFLTCRQQLITEMGLGNFAEMIGQFAGMERNAARAWSALTDEVYSEVPSCLERALTAAGHAAELLVLPGEATEVAGEVATGAAT